MKNIYICIGIWIFFLFGAVHAQTNWTDYAGNPIINEAFDAGSTVIMRPSVLFDGTSYHMWYSSTRMKNIGGFDIPVNYMAYATSADGISWVLDNPTALSPSDNSGKFDQFHASHGWVIKDGGTYKMWYWGYNLNTNESTFGYAISTDGSAWTPVDGPGALGSVYDLSMAGLTSEYGLATPCVVKAGDGYHLWYAIIEIATFIHRIGYARSPDGINWIRVNAGGLNPGTAGNFDAHSVSWPSVLNEGGVFRMWYYGAGGTTGTLGYAVSSDGAEWTRVSGGGSAGACHDGAGAVSVIIMDNLYKMWYGLFENYDRVHYAYSQATAVTDQVIGPLLIFTLQQNYPNPFNPVTTIDYALSRESHVHLSILNLQGQVIRTLVSKIQPAGTHRVAFNGDGLAGGIYLCRLMAGELVQVKKMSLLK